MKDNLQKLFSQIQDHLQKEDILEFFHLETGSKNQIETQIEAILPEDINESDKKRLKDEFLGYGPLATLIEDKTLTEILVNSYKNIWYEKEGELYQLEDHFFSKLTYENFIQRISQEASLVTNFQNPSAQGKWKNFRLHILSPPLHFETSVFSLRRHPDNPWTLSQLEKVNWASQDDIEFIKKLIEKKKSFLVIGPTGSGKTSVLNACLQEVQDRVIIIEDTSELSLPNRKSLKLLTRERGENNLKTFEAKDLVKESLRMRPDRIVMGEIRAEEAKDFLLALSTGHEGAMGSLHAKTAQEALLRLEALIQMGAPHWNSKTISHLIQKSLTHILVLNKKRKLDGIFRITSFDPKVGFLLEKEDANFRYKDPQISL